MAAACSAALTRARGLRARPSPNSSSNRNLTGRLSGSCVFDALRSAVMDMASSVNQFVFAAAALGDHDFALGGEILGEVHHQRLRLVDVAEPHRAHRLNVVEQHLAGALRHVGGEEVAYRLR